MFLPGSGRSGTGGGRLFTAFWNASVKLNVAEYPVASGLFFAILPPFDETQSRTKGCLPESIIFPGMGIDGNAQPAKSGLALALLISLFSSNTLPSIFCSPSVSFLGLSAYASDIFAGQRIRTQSRPWFRVLLHCRAANMQGPILPRRLTRFFQSC